MKKLFLTLGAAALSLSSYAAQVVLYSQNFETAESVEDTGWSYGGGSISIASDEYGKFIELALGQNNGRSGQGYWGLDVYTDAEGNSVLEDGTYTMQFDFSVKTNSNNQYNSEITVFTNVGGLANQPYRGRWSNPIGPFSNYIFDLYQANTSADTDMLASIMAPWKETASEPDEEGNVSYTYSVDLTDTKTVATSNWYTATMYVDTNSRVVEYSVVDLSGNELQSGEITVPETNLDGEAISMYAEGIWVMTARYQTTLCFDNIMIYYESESDYANEPTIALTGLGTVFDEKEGDDVVNLNARTYTITFADGEMLHVVGTDGVEEEVEWADCEGAYKYVTTTSGTLKAWTTMNEAVSTVVETTVDCTPCVLPAAEVSISSVEAGYAKTYTLTVNNAETPLRPNIFMKYTFSGNDGTYLEGSDLGSGAQVTVPGEGTLTITSEAFGYQATTVSVDNNIEYEIKKNYDFAHMTKDELAAAGFTTWNVLNSGSTSGFNNWTARKRLYYYDAATESKDDDGNTVYTAVYPFGFIAEDNTTNVIEYSEIAADDNTTESVHFDGITVYAGHNLCALYRIGVYNNETSGGNNKNIVINNLLDTDIVVANKINNYGGNSNHPVVATADEYYAMLQGENFVYLPVANEDGTYTVTVDVYRIDTVCSNLTIFGQKGTTGIADVINEAVENNDPYYYTIDGLRLVEPTHTGLYIHQGKKVYIVK